MESTVAKLIVADRSSSSRQIEWQDIGTGDKMHRTADTWRLPAINHREAHDRYVSCLTEVQPWRISGYPVGQEFDTGRPKYLANGDR